MRRTISMWTRLAPLLGLLAVSGCLGRFENGIDLVLGIGAQENLLRAPIAGVVGALALFLGRLSNAI